MLCFGMLMKMISKRKPDMIDLYTALKLCSNEEYIMLFDETYTHKQITEKFDLRNIKIKKIYFDKWHDVMKFET